MRRLIVIAAALMVLLTPTLAFGAPASGSGLDFGDPFYSTDPNALPFQTQILAPSADNTSETIGQVCLAPKSAGPLAGQLVPDASLETLRRVVREGELILANDNETIASSYDGDVEAAYKDYLLAVREGRWDDANKVRKGDVYDLTGPAGTPDPFVNAFLNPDAASSLEVRKNIPSGCIFDQQIDNASDDFGSLFSNPGTFVWRLVVWLGSVPGSSTYNWLAPITFRYSFFTPHAERGETLFNVIGSDNAQVRQYGFDPSLKTDATAATKKAPWLVLAVWLRALLSGFYVLALIGAGFIYMVRGPSHYKVNALQLIPRVLLSVILTLAIPTLIGMAITFSNLLTSELFHADPTCVEKIAGSGRCELVAQVNGVLQQSNLDLSQISNEFEAGVFQMIAVNGAALAYAFFAAVAILRQLGMILLVVLSPVACFMLILDRKHREWFTRWAKAVIGICLIPVLMALILRIGLALNPSASLLTGATISGDASKVISMPERFLSLVIMFCTFYLMAKVPRMIKGWVTGSQGASFGVQALRGAGAAMRGSGVPGVAHAGAGLYSAGGMADDANRRLGRLVPGDSAERRALPSSSMRARVARRVSGGAETSGLVEAGIVGASGLLGRGGGADQAPDPVHESAAAPTSAAGRRTIDRNEYQGMIASQSRAEQEARDSGLPVRPQEWLPGRDDEGNYWATRNPSFDNELARWQQHVRGAAAGAAGGVVASEAAEGAEPGALGPNPEIGGPPPRLEPLEAGAGAAPPGSVTGSAPARGEDGEIIGAGAPAIPFRGSGQASPGGDPVPDLFAAPSGVGAEHEAAIVADADTQVAVPLSEVHRPSIEPVSEDEMAGLFDPVPVPQVDVSSGVEQALQASVARAETDWHDRRADLLADWRAGFQRLGDEQRSDILNRFRDFRQERSSDFSRFMGELHLEGLEPDDPAVMMAWSDWQREQLEQSSHAGPTFIP